MEQIKAIYIHIPFCQTICSYCDFCKLFYNKKLVNLYLKELEKEGLIEKVYMRDCARGFYRLTRCGEDLKKIMKEIHSWSEKWILETDKN